jgi:drug/metabolite transporter (DMT)-like permease
VLAQVGLRHVAPLSGAAIAIPSSTALFICVAPFALADATPVWAAVPVFAAIGLMFPGTVTLLTFAANRALGPVMTGTLGNLAPLFAVALAFLILGEALRVPMNGGARLSNLTRIVTRQPPIGGARMRDFAFHIVWMSFFVG